MRRKPLLALLVALMLVMSSAVNVMAAPLPFDLAALSQYGEVIPDSQMDEVEGEFNPLLAGAIAGAVGGAAYYATSPGEKSLSGLAVAVGVGAVGGAVTSAATVLAAIATGTKVVTTAASTAWAAFGSANAGALTGALEHLRK